MFNAIGFDLTDPEFEVGHQFKLAIERVAEQHEDLYSDLMMTSVFLKTVADTTTDEVVKKLLLQCAEGKMQFFTDEESGAETTMAILCVTYDTTSVGVDEALKQANDLTKWMQYFETEFPGTGLAEEVKLFTVVPAEI